MLKARGRHFLREPQEAAEGRKIHNDDQEGPKWNDTVPPIPLLALTRARAPQLSGHQLPVVCSPATGRETLVGWCLVEVPIPPLE